MSIKLFTALICLALCACSFPTRDGGSITATPGRYKNALPSDPDGVYGTLIVRNAPPVAEDSNVK